MLKISGEALGGENGTGIDPDTLVSVCKRAAELVESGFEVAIVMGAGNFFRGIKGAAEGMDRVTADQMGMIATIINALALRDGFHQIGIKAVAMSAIPCGSVAELFNAQIARTMLNDSNIVLCAGGTGNPFLTTDTAATLRALELNCDVMFKATKVDGVYDSDPVSNPDAVRFDKITYSDVIDRQLGVMDLTAVTMARDGNLPMVVFNLNEDGVLKELANGDYRKGTLITA